MPGKVPFVNYFKRFTIGSEPFPFDFPGSAKWNEMQTLSNSEAEQSRKEFVTLGTAVAGNSAQ
jgi:hypothetical protein